MVGSRDASSSKKYRFWKKKSGENFSPPKYHQNRHFIKKNGHNFLENGRNALTRSIRSVFWVVWGGLFSFFVNINLLDLVFSKLHSNFTGLKSDLIFFFNIIMMPNHEKSDKFRHLRIYERYSARGGFYSPPPLGNRVNW